jgi:hypothetical protein
MGLQETKIGLQETKIETRPFAGMDHFRTTFVATWKCESDHDASRVVPLGSDLLTYTCAPTRVTVGAGTPHQFLFNEFAIRTAVGWRISSVVPGPEQ